VTAALLRHGRAPSRSERAVLDSHSYRDACHVEQRGMAALLPWLESWAYRLLP